MKKLLFLFTTLLLISCSSDDSEDGIIGKWQLTQHQAFGNPCVVDESTYCPSLIDGEYWWIFKNDGTYSNNTIRRSSNDFVNYNHYGTWRRSGTSSKIMYQRSTQVASGTESFFDAYLSNSDNTLSIEDGGTYIFTRVY
tara:strand:+ start:204 stop:620 length:417 start_codon:yes stop_codon:yes gene_type:complete